MSANGNSGAGHATMTGSGRTGGGGGAPGDLTAVQSGDAGVVVTNGTGPIPIVSQVIAAKWPVANMRIYAVDFVNGLDTNTGFADAAGTSAANYAAASVAAGVVAKKTFAGLAAIFPRVGNGRLVEIVIANGGVNTAQAYAGGLETFLGGCTGWGGLCPFIRATGTNATAGAVAFAGSTAEFDYQGAITATGCNTAGYNPVAALSASAIKVLKVGGGAAAIPIEPAIPLGWRIRFDAATTTVALRNINRQIAQVSGTDTLIPQTAFPAVPAGTDVCYLEQAGITCDTTILGSTLGASAVLSTTTAMQIAGIRITGSLMFQDFHVRMAFCGAETTTRWSGHIDLLTAQSVIHPVLGSRTIGGGFRAANTGGSNLFSGVGGSVVLAGFVTGAGGINPATLSNFVWGAGCYCAAILDAQNLTLPAGIDSSTTPHIGITASLAQPRAQSIINRSTTAEYSGCKFEGAGANAAITVLGKSVLLFSSTAGGTVGGSVGNNDVGMTLASARGAVVILGHTPTVTGALGDIRLAGGQIITWAQAAATGIVDSAGNRILGTLGVPPQAISLFSGSVIGAAGAVISYLSDTGPIAVNQAVALRRPTSFRLATRLRATNLVNTSANNVALTLYKNGVATAMTFNIPGGSAANTKFVDTAHPILFLDGDDFDLRLDDGADVGGVVTISASLEWAV